MIIMFFSKVKNLEVKKTNQESKIKQLAFLDESSLLQNLETSREGLSSEQVTEKLEQFGYNIIQSDQVSTIFRRLLDSVINPFNIVLLIVAIITFLTDVLLAEEADMATVFVIITLIILSSAIAFLQNEKSTNAANKLSKMISNKADVLRDGKWIELEIDKIVPGDLIKLSAGDMLPGDLRFLFTKDTFLSQSSLTGESTPIEKFANINKDIECTITDIGNIGFMGTNILSGSALGVILATGNDTYIGSMAKSLSGGRAKNSFERGIDSISKLLIRFMIIMVPVIFFINGFTKGDWGNSLLFALSVAVGLTPEMLPVIMTSTLASGAIKMSKHQTIVKNLSAIQTFGEMNVLCTDKTGTLTEDRIILEKYMDVHGRDDMRILRHAYLNSYFQTGLKNLLDLAIIKRADESSLSEISSMYKCVDEIPFDFTRRRMSVVLEDKNGKYQLITKGAVEEIVSICKYVEHDGSIQPLDNEHLADAMKVYEKHNCDGLRVIAIAQKNQLSDTQTFGIESEKDMVLIGFIGFLDPPKQSAALAITALKEHGVRTIVLTGDSEGVAIKVCSKVGVNSEICLTGTHLETMTDEELDKAVLSCNIFSKLSPTQKSRVIISLQKHGFTVGYMGDGINDALALRQADIGISVDTGVDIAKETADIILLKKDLMVLENGIQEGRRTFGNIMKYIKMAASGNLGNMFSMMIAGIFLPFLPMLPIHLLTQNLLCDFSQMGIPFDNMDKEYIDQPRKWDPASVKRFMLVMGPISSIFDLACFSVLWWIIKANTVELSPLFHAGWFIFGTLSQILVVHMIRTSKLPFVESRAATPLLISTLLVGCVAIFIAFTDFAINFDFIPLPFKYIPWLGVLLLAYALTAQLIKKVYVKRYSEWI